VSGVNHCHPPRQRSHRDLLQCDGDEYGDGDDYRDGASDACHDGDGDASCNSDIEGVVEMVIVIVMVMVMMMVMVMVAAMIRDCSYLHWRCMRQSVRAAPRTCYRARHPPGEDGDGRGDGGDCVEMVMTVIVSTGPEQCNSSVTKL
jgi:hypothetical protein